MSARRIRTVLFDFDQTLGYMPRGHLELYVQAAREHGLRLTAEQLAARPLTDAWAKWMTPDGPDHSASSATREAFRALRGQVHARRIAGAGVPCDAQTLAAVAARVCDLEADPEHYALFDDSLPALDRLARAGVQSLVVSNHVWELPLIVRALGCGAKFEGVVTSARAGYRKPHPEIFRAALRLADSDPAETLMVGDSLRDDVEGAARLGMPAVLLDRGTGGARGSEGVRVIRSLLEIPLEWT